MSFQLQKYNQGSSSIVVFKQEDISHISSDLRPYIEAKNYPIVSQMSENSAKNRIKDLILTLYMVCGQNIGDDDKSLATIAIFRDILYADIKKKWPSATIKEISSALNAGVRGEYEKQTGKLFGGVTITNCNIWIDYYFKSEKRSTAFVMLSTPKPLPPSKEDPEKAKAILDAGFALLRNTHVEPLKKEEAEKRKKRIEEIKTSKVPTTFDRDQLWLMQFDQHHARREFFSDMATGKGFRLIYRYGQMLSVNDFMKRKIEQLQFVKTYLEERAKRK